MDLKQHLIFNEVLDVKDTAFNDNRYVNTSGDTMTGALSVSPGFTVTHPDSGENFTIEEKATSYNNQGGKGDRDGFITATDSGNVWYNGTMGGAKTVNGLYSDNYMYYNNGQAISSATWMKWDFGVSVVITEARVLANAATAVGVWKWQGSDNDSDWTDIGANFTLGASNPDIHTSLNGNSTAYRYYRMLGVSGTLSWNALIYQWDFKIDGGIGGTAMASFTGNVGFNVDDPEGQFDVKALSSSSGDWVFRVKDSNSVQHFGVLANGVMGFGIRNETPYNSTVLPTQLNIDGQQTHLGNMYIAGIVTSAVYSVTNIGTPGSTTYTYKVFPMVNVHPQDPFTVTTTTGNATLSGTNYNKITWEHTKGATHYKVFRTAGGATQGWLGTINAANNLEFNDTNVTGDGSSSSYLQYSGTGKLTVARTPTLHATYRPFGMLQVSDYAVTQYNPALHLNSNFAIVAASTNSSFTIDNTYIPNWSKVAITALAGINAGGSGRNSIGVFTWSKGGYLGAYGHYTVTEAVGAVDSYGHYVKNIGYTGKNSYGLYVAAFGGSATNYAILTNDGNVVLNESGSATSDLRVESDNYDAIFVDASDNATYIMNHASGKISFFGATPVTKQTELTDELTTITHTAPGTPDYAIQDLVDSSAGATFGFATKDEGNTVLSVIANLQARVNELETKLTNYGLLIDAD